MRSVVEPAALRPVAAAACTLLLLTGCASLPSLTASSSATASSAAVGGSRGPGATPVAAAAPAASASAAAGAAGKGGPAAAAPAAGSPPPFATVIKDAKRTDGLLALWQKDDKVWIELRPQDLNKPMFLSPKIAQGIGEVGLFGGMVVGRWQPWGRPQIVEFRRVHNQVRLIARNEQFVAARGTPEGRAVDAAFSDSLLGSTAVASLPHPENKAVLIEANPLLLTDLLGLGINLQRAYRQGYSFDARNSAITSVRGMPDELVFDVSSHFASNNLSLPQSGGSPGAPGAPVPSLPDSLPDARSLFIGVHYSLARLPETPMAPRKADPRVGHFTSLVQNFGADLDRTPKQRFVNRWRLEKKDPAAALSEPVKPITFWLDRTIPLKYRDAVVRGVLEWNKAFERIGFKDALVVKIQPDDASFDTLDLNIASIRWMTNAKPIFGAIGPSHVDPRTGEILDADIGIEGLSSRNLRAARAQILTSRASIDWPALLQSGAEPGASGSASAVPNAFFSGAGHDHARCEQGLFAAEQLSYALDVLEARGEIAPDGPEAEAFVQAYLTDTTMHEVGHTLGLRHNFRSSRIYTDAQLSDPGFTQDHGLAGSVMEYAAINLAAPGGRSVAPFQTTLGPYDYWAIEYAYKPMSPQASAADQEAELQRIARRGAEPELAYGTDEDNGIGIDPEALMFDLGDDPVAFARKRISIAQDLLSRQENRPLKSTEDYSVLRRALGYAMRDAARASGVLLRQIGGLRTLRDFPGTGRDPLQPVAANVQRAALAALTSQVLAAGSFRISPALGRKLGPDFQERIDSADGGVSTDFTLESIIVDMQRAVLARLMSDGLSARLLDAYEKADRPQDTLPLNDVYEVVTREIWSELDRNTDINSARRELQREHASRLVATLLRPSSSGRADARSLLRLQAKALLARIEAPRARPALSAEAKAHLADSAEMLRLALAAPLQRGT